jgi:adenosylmethionine-8-amino-7-oxononanoate aminotransferase
MSIDGTERRTQRPTDVDKQKRCYSGKKTHTVKNNLLVDVEERLVRYLSGMYEGSVHDKRICDAVSSRLCAVQGYRR